MERAVWLGIVVIFLKRHLRCVWRNSSIFCHVQAARNKSIAHAAEYQDDFTTHSGGYCHSARGDLFGAFMD